MDINPKDLVEPAGTIRPLRPVPTTAAKLAARLDLRLEGENYPIRSLGSISDRQSDLCYLAHERYASHLAGRTGRTIITTQALRPLVSPGNALLLTDESPKDTFYTLFAAIVEDGAFEQLQSYLSPAAHVAAGAMIAEHVHVAAGAVVMSGSVILPNSYVGHGVVIKPNATIGGDGFEVAMVGGRKRVVSHAGGVWLSEGVEIGSSTCVDRGLFGEFTYLGTDTKVDNLVHFAHSSHAGRDCYITACAELSGSVRLGDGVWLAPGTVVLNGVALGDHAYTGLGSVIAKDVPGYTLAFGSPARCRGYICRCRCKLNFIDGTAECEQCGARFTLHEKIVIEDSS